MARLILIQIDDNAEADNFLKAIEADNVLFAKKVGTSTVGGVGEVDEVSWNSLEGAKVEAVWAKPTQFCTCDDYTGTSAPTTKYRWMVHAKCAKPRAGAMQHPRDLSRIDTPANEIPYYLGFRADSKGWRLR